MTLTEKAGRHTKRKRKKEMLIFPNRKVKPKIKMIVMIFKNKGTALCRQRLKFTGGHYYNEYLLDKENAVEI